MREADGYIYLSFTQAVGEGYLEVGFDESIKILDRDLLHGFRL